MALLDIFTNPVPRRYLDYTTDINITDVPFAGDVNIPLEGRTKPVTDLSEIAPTTGTQNVLTEGIANAALRNKFDFTQPFSTVVKGSGQPYIRDPNKTYDYSGYKLGNPEEGIMGMGKEVWEGLKTIYGGNAANIIANTLGDYTATYTPGVPQLGIEDVMNISDRYDFVGKSGEGHGSPYDINVDLPPDLLAQIKNYSEKDTIVPDDRIMETRMIPSLEDLKTGWKNLTRAGDKNLSEFDITSTMGVETPEIPSGLSTDVYGMNAPAYETFAPDTDYSALGKDYEEIAADEMAFAEGIKGLDLSDMMETPYTSKKGWRPSWKNVRDIGSAVYGGARKTFPPTLAYDIAQGINFQNLRGGLTQRGYEKERQDRRNLKSRQNIIKTLQSGKYAPGWKETAFQRVQDLTKNLNLVDAADAGTTITPPDRDGGQTSGQRATEAAQRDDPGLGGHKKGGRVRFSKGGIVDLWRELSNL